MSNTGRLAGRQARIAQLAQRRAFDAYLRWGRTPDAGEHLKAAAAELWRKALGEARPTTHYTWRTARDPKVRDAHAAHEGRVFAWSDPPAGGHPGEAHNCRCWAEPYYGAPNLPDVALPLRKTLRSDPSGTAVWQLIETLTRPDGSLAESLMLLRDGTSITSAFRGAIVTNTIRLPDGRTVRLERQDGVQSIYLGSSQNPVLQSMWTANGPKLVRERQRVARGPLPDLVPSDPAPGDEFEEIEVFDPTVLPPGDAGLGGVIGLALLAFFLGSQAEPAVLGGGPDDKPALTIRIWTPDGRLTPVPVSVTSLTAQQAAEICERLPEVQTWVDEAVMKLAPLRTSMSAADWGKLVHRDVELTVKALKDAHPQAYANTWAERTYAPDATIAARSGLGSSRLDVIEILEKAVCIYDIKTGKSGLSGSQLQKYTSLAARFGKLTFYIFQITPTEPSK